MCQPPKQQLNSDDSAVVLSVGPPCEVKGDVPACQTWNDDGFVSWETDRPIPQHVWRIHGRDYDLTGFVDDHPGGVHMIMLGKGTDCTNLFESYHIINEPRKRLRTYDVTPDGLQPAVPECPSAFLSDLRTMVREHFGQEKGKKNDGFHKAHPWAVVVHVLLVCVEIGVGYWWYTKCSMLAAFLLGLISWLLMCNSSHDASHGALSHRAWVNTLFHYTTAPFQTGQCSWWLQHVVSHHQYTNVPGHDVDAHHQCFARWHRAVPAEILGGRWFGGFHNLWWHFLTYIGSTVGMSIIHPFKFLWIPLISHRFCGGLGPKYTGLIDERDEPRHGFFCPTSHDSAFEKIAGNFARQGVVTMRYSTLFGNLFIWLLSIWCLHVPFIKCLLEEEAKYESHRAPVGKCIYALMLVLVPFMVSSLCFMCVTQISHIQAETQEPAVTAMRDPFMRQAMTSMDYSPGSSIVQYLTGGLNLQSIHHMLPTVSLCHYHALYPKFLVVCRKHGCEPSCEPTFFHCLAKHLLYVFRLGYNDPRFAPQNEALVIRPGVAVSTKATTT
mmetsp:Transcript_21070/g.55448  ORF Transcript_21070/g.55448 Transcript_21070/m.55448 type:complete len:552 (-) Transcript_21070:212-1867(-)